MTRVGLLGYGEVGKNFGTELTRRGHEVRAYDILVNVPMAGPKLREHAREAGVQLVRNAAGLAERTDLIISAVTAGEALNAARAAAPALTTGTWYLDINSVSPETKVRCAGVIDGAGGRYVEAAVMSAVPPHGLASPMLLGGRWAAEFAVLAGTMGFEARAVSDQIGIASATKMCRSVIVKGLEALFIEGFAAARAYGVEQDVLEYLQRSYPGFDWEAQAGYFFERVMTHGRRRAEEMLEAAETVRATGLEPLITSATAERQSSVAEMARSSPPGAKTGNWIDCADWLLRAAATNGRRARR